MSSPYESRPLRLSLAAKGARALLASLLLGASAMLSLALSARSALAEEASEEAEEMGAEAESQGESAADEQELPPLDPNGQRPPSVRSDDAPFKPNRWVDAGGFVGPVLRPSGSGPIQYGVGIAYGAYLRPELTEWLGATLYYRQESIPVKVDAGGFDYGGTSYSEDWTQPSLKLVSLGVRAEPTWVVHPRLRLYGILGIGWARFVAPMPEAEGEYLGRSRRAAVELDYVLGAGIYIDLIPNWLNAGFSASYGFVGNQSGSAYEALQIVKDGQIMHFAPLPKTKGVGDLLFSLALIL